MSNFRHRILTWFLLACVLIGFTISVVRLNPISYFGLMEDDTIYFSSAKALAAGQGYILPSVPGNPAATKYPILYPWLLSWVWRLNPNFPGNINDAVALNIAFGYAFIIGAFVFFKEVGGLRDGEAVFLTAFCSLHPLVIVHTANLLTETPFAALTMWAILFATRVTKPSGDPAAAVVSGLLSGAALLTRVVGIPLAGGLFLAVLYRRGWRRSLLFAGGVAPFFGILIWSSVAKAASQAPQLAMSQCSRVWKMSWLYYTGYLSFWRADAIESHAIWSMIKQNLTLLVIQPGMYFLDPQFLKPRGAVIIAAFLLSVVIWNSLIQQARGELKAIHFAFALYLVPVALYENYPLVERFLLPFLPLIVLGLWLEMKKLVKLIRRSFAKGSGSDQRPAAVFLGMVLAAVVVFAGWSFKMGRTIIVRNSKFREEVLEEKRAAYEWLKKNTSADATVIAYEHASLYLYTNRRSFRPVIFTPAGRFDANQYAMEVACVDSGAKALHAGYTLITDDDFRTGPGNEVTLARLREKEAGNGSTVVFRSPRGRVLIVQSKKAELTNGE